MRLTARCAIGMAAAVLWMQALPAQEIPAQRLPEFTWPQATARNRLWTRWWWLGNAVDEANITRQLGLFHEAGLGGVEICPIYGALGAEDRYLEFLSTDWMRMLSHTYRQAIDLGMAVDMTTGTGWPFGGNRVKPDDASKGIVLKVYDHRPAAEELPTGLLVCLTGYPPNGEARIISPPLGPVLPPGTRYVAAIQTGPMQQVKRAAPGAEGHVLDPYSVDALNGYLTVFDEAFQGFQDDLPRAQFHDSFEYYGATWTQEFFAEFQKRRGYDLRHHLLALAGDASIAADTQARVKCDYRETLSDLHLEYLSRWTEWAHTHGSLSRNQAHGGPGNLIDFYGSADIPECEIFRLYDDSNVPFLKMASSAAHLGGRRLTSSESFTWLREHFTASFSDIKPAADFLFLTGVNHLFLHGIPYSPEDAAWPGWQFYASINFGPQGGLWHDMPAFAAYVQRVQSILQENLPSNDVLVYMPFHQFWSDPAHNDKMMFQFTHPGTWMKSYPVYEVASALWANGISFDTVSDRFLEKAKVEEGWIVIGDGKYRSLIVPTTPVMAVATMERIGALAREGARIEFAGSVPADVPGLADLESRRGALRALTANWNLPAGESSARVTVGRGSISRRPMEEMVREMPAEFRGTGLRSIRRMRPDGYDYFLVNATPRAVDGWVALGTPARSAILMDPRFEDRIGEARLQHPGGAQQPPSVYVQLLPGESMILRTFTDKALSGESWRYTRAGPAVALNGPWDVTFIEGGPNLPRAYSMDTLVSWTAAPDEESRRFAGTARYTLEFNRPPGDAVEYELNLGQVADSARVTLNGNALGTLWAAPFRLGLGSALRPGRNILEVEVTNVAANRIRDLDRRGVQWKIFRDINVVNVDYAKFDASDWPIREAGLLGPVTLAPLTAFVPQ